MAIWQLEELDSASAEILLRVEFTREIIAAKLSRLSVRHATLENLLSVMFGARFKYYYHGTLLPAWRPSKFRGDT